MSRVTGYVVLKEKSVKENNAISRIVSTVAIVDMWSLYTVRKTSKMFVKILRPILETVYLIAIGLLLLFALVNVKCNLSMNKENYVYETPRQMNGELLPISDETTAEKISLRKEISVLKSKTLSLDMMIRKMNKQFQNFYLREKNKDKTLPDFASEAVGGLILRTPNTESFYEPQSFQLTLFGIPIWKPNYFTPRKIIQPWSQAGECWAFRGSHGKVEVELAYPITITHVTLEHIPVSLSLTGAIDSAPKEFTVFGRFRDIYVTIDTFLYHIDGPPSQTFPIKQGEIRNVPFKRVLLEVLSNWGNPKYTCIYRFKVHGKIFKTSN